MPELPEVETVRSVLSDLIIGKKIESVEVLCEKMIKNVTVDVYEKSLTNQEITDVRRYGKYLLIDTNDFTVISHLRMEGKYNFYDEIESPTKHDYILFYFSDNSELRYNDTRKFGTMELVKKGCENEQKAINKLGLEPYNPDLNIDYFKEKTMKKTLAIKKILLDQTIITGLGNIYVDEVLFKAKIHPLTPVYKLTDSEIEIILKYSKEIILKAIKAGGTTVKSFSVTGNVDGKFQYSLNVYGRDKEPCYLCNTKIRKIKVGGRGTHYCLNCQGEI